MHEMSLNEVAVAETAEVTPGRFLPSLLMMFVGSGCSALIYEIVWFQLLELVIGSSTVSLGILLGTFMGGMCLGSLLFPRLISRTYHPLRVYALLELTIGVIGLAILFAMPVVAGAYTAWAGSGFFGLVIRSIVAGVCLIPPTLLMGATLPAISRWVETTPKGVSWLGFFYGGNIAGAVIGSLLAGFYLMRVHDISITTYVAFALNVTVAVLSLTLSKATSYASADEAAETVVATGSWPIYPSVSRTPLFTFQLDLVRTLWVVLPAAILWGASFPLALASVASRGQDPARLVGGVYAANTVGAIVGSLSASLILVVTIGSQ